MAILDKLPDEGRGDPLYTQNLPAVMARQRKMWRTRKMMAAARKRDEVRLATTEHDTAPNNSDDTETP